MLRHSKSHFRKDLWTNIKQIFQKSYENYMEAMNQIK